MNTANQETSQNIGSEIFAVPVADKYLLYSPLQDITALVNRQAAGEIRNCLENKSRHVNSSGEMDSLITELVKPLSKFPSEKQGPMDPQFLGILPTRSCNMSCKYCGFGAGKAGNATMDLNMAAAAVDWMADNLTKLGKDLLEIHFFGGEPFTAPDVVDVVIHRGRKLASEMGLQTHFEASTNGFLSEDTARFAGDYFDSIVLSFDGPEEVHNFHRPVNSTTGSFDAVERTAHILAQSQTELCLRSCITNKNVHLMEETVRWFCRIFQPSVINFETLRPTEQALAAGIRPPGPFEFAQNCIKAWREVERNGIQAVYAAAVTGSSRASFCPVGNDTVIVSPDGRLSSCYLLPKEWQTKGLDMDIGILNSGGTMDIDMSAVQRLRKLVTDKHRCKSCFCRWDCSGGCHVSDTWPGCPDAYDDFCIQTRIISACRHLDSMGHSSIADSILNDASAMERLAHSRTDKLRGKDI